MHNTNKKPEPFALVHNRNRTGKIIIVLYSFTRVLSLYISLAIIFAIYIQRPLYVIIILSILFNYLLIIF
jgi:hypothetical protein